MKISNKSLKFHKGLVGGGGVSTALFILAAQPLVSVAGTPLAPVSPPVSNPASEGLQSEISPMTTSCSWTFNSGVGHNATQYCVTANGNITQFSRGGAEYIAAGGYYEGYGICDTTAGVEYQCR